MLNLGRLQLAPVQQPDATVLFSFYPNMGSNHPGGIQEGHKENTSFYRSGAFQFNYSFFLEGAESLFQLNSALTRAEKKRKDLMNFT